MMTLAGVSTHLILTIAAMMVVGAAWMILIAQFDVAVQMAVPRWVTARALACFSCAIMGGMAIGAWAWGAIANAHGVAQAMILSGVTLACTSLIGLLLRLPNRGPSGLEMHAHPDLPEMGLALTPPSGPIIIEIDYRVDPEHARDYYAAMQKLRSARLRSGAFGWTLSRDIADPELWTEHYVCPTWGDYLHQRDGMTQGDRALQRAVDAFHTGGNEGRVRRKLERPTGSVRWRAETPDRYDEHLGLYTP